MDVVTGPRAGVRVTIRRDQVDEYGVATPDALRWIRATMWDIPAEARVTLDLGPVRMFDHCLVDAIAAAAPHLLERLQVESSDWRLAHRYTLGLLALIDVA